jgi:hypothetical protein
VTAVISPERLRAGLGAAVAGGGGLSAADRLCRACVEFLEVDGAAISVIHEGASWGTFGSSGELSKRLDEFQFTFGEGPCLDAISQRRPVLVADLGDPAELRWPAFRGAVLDAGVRAVFALPVAVVTAQIGALDLFRSRPGRLAEETLAGGMLAAELAALPLLDLMSADVDWKAAGDGGDGWAQLASLERVEVYQATGMIMGMLDVGPTEALVRLRAHAYASGLTASAVAWSIVERRLELTDDSGRGSANTPGAAS